MNNLVTWVLFDSEPSSLGEKSVATKNMLKMLVKWAWFWARKIFAS